MPERVKVKRAPTDISPKVLNPAIASAIATIVSALDGQVDDVTTIVLAVVTVAVAVIGYFSKDKVELEAF